MADETENDATEHDGPGLELLLDFLRQTRFFDFSGYKRSSLARRIERRMQTVGIHTYREYAAYLDRNADEFPLLFDTVLINVTGFFRDPPAWEALGKYLPRIFDAHPRQRPIRVWSAGCASGEEAYTLAMALAEVVGIDEFVNRVKIYATDIDEDALNFARHATFDSKALEGVPPELREKYFTRTGTNYAFHKELRRAVVFGRHDLVQDAPISRVDLLSCRNTLMYFNAEAQARTLRRLHFALSDEGVLFLGKAEMLLTHAHLFTPLELKLRIFERTAKTRPMPPPLEVATLAHDKPDARGELRARLSIASIDCASIAQVLLDPTGRIALVNQRAHALFGISHRDVGRPFHDLELSYRPAELRSCIDQARSERRVVVLREVEHLLINGDRMYLDVEVMPLNHDSGLPIGTQVTFTDVTQAQRLRLELRRSQAELEAAHEELQSTSEELETTNEELQSTVEELETTNEELQSTNEQLETMNEELQSTNEELQTINEELRRRGKDLNELNAFFGAILGSLRAGVAVLDGDLLVKVWNVQMAELWGLRAEEVLGKPFLVLDIGLPIERLGSLVRAALLGDDIEEEVVDGTNRRGRAIRCRVRIERLRSHDTRAVVVLVDELQ